MYKMEDEEICNMFYQRDMAMSDLWKALTALKERVDVIEKGSDMSRVRNSAR